MTFYELFSHADRFRYRAHIISSSTCVQFICVVLTFLSPFLLTYYTGGFRLDQSVYSEQPQIGNTTKYVLIVDTIDASTSLTRRFVHTSYATLNRDFLSSLVFGEVNEGQTDTNGDGLLDQFRFSFEMIFTTPATNINSINLLLAFQYQLSQRQTIVMETLALISFIPSSPLMTNSQKNITIFGQSIFTQRQTIKNVGLDPNYNYSIIDPNGIDVPNLTSILDSYFQRKYYTVYETEYVSIAPVSSPLDNLIVVDAVVNFGRQAIQFTPGFWEEFKWGWIQYVFTLLPFLIIFDRLKFFVFTNELVRVIKPIGTHPHQS